MVLCPYPIGTRIGNELDRDQAAGLPVAATKYGATRTLFELVLDVVPIKHLCSRLIRLERMAILRYAPEMYVLNLA